MTPLEEARARFWSKVKIGKVEDCWPYLPGKTGRYGQFHATRVTEMRGTGAHRWAVFFQTGRVPEEVSHQCNNTRCVNPSHLREGSHLENEQHKDACGRRPRGVKQLPCPKCGGPQEGRSKRAGGRIFAFCVPCRRDYNREYAQRRRRRRLTPTTCAATLQALAVGPTVPPTCQEVAGV